MNEVVKGVWKCLFHHLWDRWEDYGHIDHITQRLSSGVKVVGGKSMVQERRCARCGAVAYRRVRV